MNFFLFAYCDIYYISNYSEQIINESIKNLEKDEFSFIYSTNGMTVFPDEKNFNNGYKFKVLLCACKKYIKNQKNGILLVNIDDELYKIDYNSSLKINYYFYDTKNFEVYCFCPIFIFEKTKNVLKNHIQSTDYFFVGGFDKEKNKGMIKLYRIDYGIEYHLSKIEYIQDVNIDKDDNFKKFKGPISSIIQSNNTGEILVSCWDGNTYLFNKPNFENYME